MSTTQAAAVVKAIPDQVVKDLPRHAAKVFRNLPGKVAKYNAEGREIQGRRRFIRSNAAKNFIRGESARVASALQSRHHGKNIYAYNHIKTKQVVYSLTRDLQYNSVIKQMIYHGKKTIPPSIRKDVWQPYFSVHFPDATSGLKAFKRLIEFSRMQQLTPDPSRITVTKEFLEEKRPKNPDDVEAWEKKNLYTIGYIMNKRQRAETLMNQHATSVADLAAVLSLRATELEQPAQPKETDEEKLASLSKKKRKVLRQTRDLEASVAERKQELLAKTEAFVRKRLNQPLYTASEHHNGNRDLIDGNEIDISGVEVHDFPDSTSVKVLWADRDDASYAAEWPATAMHGELMPAIESRHIIGYERPGSLQMMTGQLEAEQSAMEQMKLGENGTEKSAGGKTEGEVKKGDEGLLSNLQFWKKK